MKLLALALLVLFVVVFPDLAFTIACIAIILGVGSAIAVTLLVGWLRRTFFPHIK